MKIRKGDTVEVITGEDVGLRGTVHTVLPKERRVVVSGVNVVRKAQKPTGNVRTQTGIIEVEAPLDISNIALVCPHCDKPVRVGYYVSAGIKSRVCRQCREIID